jgi:hypothetical protein
LAGEYLNRNQERIKQNVETFPEERWHVYTRANNIARNFPKVYIPMTALDTFAAVTFSDRHYCDNANVNYVELPEINEVNLYALASIINSTVYSVLARSIANPQSNGYFKFNKQFLEPVPFPGENFAESVDLKTQLFEISRRIEGLQVRYKSSSPNQKRGINALLQRQWDLLDDICYQLYELNDEEKAFFNERGRNIDRIEILNNN